MIATNVQIGTLAVATLAAIETDQRVPMPSLETSEIAYLGVRRATQAMDWTLAAMPAHQVERCGRYLRWLLEQEPLRSHPMCEPQRVVIGLLLLALRDIYRQQPESEVAS